MAPEAVATGARHIANSIMRGKNVALDILRFTQPAEPSIRPFDLREWWDRFSPEMRATTRNSIEFDVSIERGITLLGDASQLSQLVGNLISNGRDAMPHGGTLGIAARIPAPGETFAFGVVRSSERFAQLSVADTGTGMTPHVREHAFDPLFTTKQNGGTGLGLAVAHQIVARHGGSIFVESEVGAGTTFHVFLPVVGAVAPAAAARPEPARIRARRILLVEDERDIATGLAALLADLDVETVIAPTGGSAPEAARQFHPDAVLLDVGLPRHRRLRSRTPAARRMAVSEHRLHQRPRRPASRAGRRPEHGVSSEAVQHRRDARDDRRARVADRAAMSAPARTALVVDDDPFLSELLTVLLESRGFTVDARSDGIQAVELERDYDVILLDLKMPVFDGESLTDYWQLTRPGILDRVIVLTGYSRRFDLRMPRTFGVLTKPFEHRELFDLVERCVGRPRLREEKHP